MNCCFCSLEFSCPLLGVNHVFAKHGSETIHCSTCKDKVKLSALKVHKRKHINDEMELESFKCKICSFVGHAAAFIKHLRNEPHNNNELNVTILKRSCVMISEYTLCCLMYKKEILGY